MSNKPADTKTIAAKVRKQIKRLAKKPVNGDTYTLTRRYTATNLGGRS